MGRHLKGFTEGLCPTAARALSSCPNRVPSTDQTQLSQAPLPEGKSSKRSGLSSGHLTHLKTPRPGSPLPCCCSHFHEGQILPEKFDRVPTLVNDRTATDTMYMDLCKAFLPVADNIFISHLERCGVYSWNINCGAENGLDGLTQRVVVNISMSVRRRGMRGDLQRLILVPLLLPIFVRHRDNAIDCPFSKIGNDIKVSGVVACLEGRDGTQRDLDRLGRLGGVIVMKVNRTKCNVLNLNWSNLNNGH